MRTRRTAVRSRAAALGAVLVLVMAACGDDDDDAASSATTEPRRRKRRATEAPAAAATARRRRRGASSSPSTRGPARRSTPTSPRSCSSPSSARRSNSSTSTRTPPGRAWTPARLDANLEIWPSGHAADYKTYITRRRPSSTSACSARRPRSAGTCRRSSSTSTPNWRRGKASRIPTLAKLFATAESGDQGQFLMGDPSYVTLRRADHHEPQAAAEVRRRRLRGGADHRHPARPRPIRSRCCCSSGSRTGCSRRSS